MDKQTVVYPHNVYYLAIKMSKLLMDATCNYSEDSERQYVE